jgi:hypothetical protein
MRRRRRDPLIRAAGALLVYVSLLLMLLWLPGITIDELLAAALCFVVGVYALCQTNQVWCSSCWHVIRETRGETGPDRGGEAGRRS